MILDLYPPSLGTEDSFHHVKLPGHAVDQSLSLDMKVINERSYISTHPMCLHDMDIYNFTLLDLQMFNHSLLSTNIRALN